MRENCAPLGRVARILLFVLSLVGSAAVATAAPIIDFVATDVPDVIPGEDLWRYDYTVSGIVFDAHQGFDIFFAPDLYANLSATSPSPDWDVLVIQPDVALPDAGIYSAIANIAVPPLPAFFVQFEWLGSGIPGSQPFTVSQYDAQHDLILQELAIGRTGSVTEPGALLLLAGLGSALYRRRRLA